MATENYPYALFVHGSWHTPEHWKRIRTIFETKGIPTSCPRQATVGNFPPVGIKEDTSIIRAELERLIEREQQEVVIFGHSYGGIVTTQVADLEFSIEERKKRQLKGGIVGIVYIAAFVLSKEGTVKEVLGGKLSPYIHTRDDGTCFVPEARQIFFNDLPLEDQEHYFDLLERCPFQAGDAMLENKRYIHHPTTYLFCEDDEGLPLESQKSMVENAEKESGVKFKHKTCKCGHSPYLSYHGMEKILEIYHDTAGRYIEEKI